MRDVAGPLERPGDAEALSREHAVEADHGRELRHVSAGQERLEAPEAESDRGDGARARPLAQRGGGSSSVLLDAGDGQLLDVGHVLELLVARAETGGPAEVVHRDRVVAGLREPLGQLRVERVEAPDVGEDHDSAPAVRRRLGERGREMRAIGGGELEDLSPRAAGDRGEQQVLGRRRRPRVEVEAHPDRQNTGMTEATTSATDPTTFRAQFPVLERLSYLNAGTEGPIPRAAAEAVRERIGVEADGGRCGRPYFEELMELADRARAGYATALGCEPADVALTGSTTDGVNTVIAGYDLRPGDEIVTSDQEHPGLLAPLGRARRRHGVKIRVVPFAEIAGEVSSATRLVACSHVSWVGGEVADVAALVSTGVPVLLDAAQALGAVPIDACALGVDFYAGSGQKWLCGPEGSGALFVREDRLDDLLVPWPGYGSVADPANALEFEQAEGVKRLDHGFPAGLRNAWATASLGLFEEVGWEWVHERAALMAARLAERLAERGLSVAPRGRSTLVSWAAEDPDAEVARLAAERVIVRSIPAFGLVRASVGAWTSEEEIERLVELAAA